MRMSITDMSCVSKTNDSCNLLLLLLLLLLKKASSGKQSSGDTNAKKDMLVSGQHADAWSWMHVPINPMMLAHGRMCQKPTSCLSHAHFGKHTKDACHTAAAVKRLKLDTTDHFENQNSPLFHHIVQSTAGSIHAGVHGCICVLSVA